MEAQKFSEASIPRQKLPIAKKTQQWRESCIDAAINHIRIHNNSRRSPKYRKKINYDLYNGKLNTKDLEYVTNPFGFDNIEFPASIQPYDVWSPIFNLLFGEESKRPLNFVVTTVNDEAITDKENTKKDFIMQRLQEYLVAADKGKPIPNSEEELKKYMSYTEQDIRESIATKILNYLKRDLNLDIVFSKGWEDALIAGEEIYCIESFVGEPSLRRVNPLELYCILPHNSDIIDDAEVIMEQTFMSYSSIIDIFHDKLTDEQIEKIEDLSVSGGAASLYGYNNVLEVEFLQNSSNLAVDPHFDYKGNMRVYKVIWKSKKKVGKLKYLDPTTGQQEETLVDETFKVDKENPDMSIEWIWINQYWQGYKVADDIIFDVRPKPMQFRRMDNPSICKSGYVGTIYNANNSQSVSLMDRMTPWIYLYIIIGYRTELGIAKNLGKLARINISMIPDGWEIEKWLYYATAMGIAFEDPFNEGKKGASQGKLAGNMNQASSGSIDLETGNYIQSHISLLEFIENKLAKLSGVTPQRMGAVQASELVNNVERSVLQSSIITEKWFQLHNWTKQRALECLIECAKVTWADNKSKKLQYIMDDMTSVFFSVDMDVFNNSEYGVFVSNSVKDMQTIEALKSYVQAGLQNDKLEFSQVIDIYNSESPSDIKRKLVTLEEERKQMAQKQQQAEMQMQQGQINIQKQLQDDNHQWESSENEKDRQNKIDVATVNAMGFEKDQDMNNNGIPDVLEIEKLKVKAKETSDKIAVEKDKMNKESDDKAKERKHQKELKDKDLQIKREEMINKLKIAKSKPKPKSK